MSVVKPSRVGSKARARPGVARGRIRPRGAQAATADAERVGVLLARCRRLMWRTITHRLAGAGQSLHMYRLLSELVRHGPRAQRDLALATAQHAAAISRMVEELVQQGLIKRQPSGRDRREIIVAVTPRGRARFRAEHPVVAAAIQEIVAPLSRAEQRRLASLLEAILAGHQPGGPAARAPGLVQLTR
jgi:DNA-binding MarR family transcriptional regulator